MDAIIKQLIAGSAHILPAGQLEKKIADGKKLRIKFGMDPTAPDLHLGHAVVLSKIKLFQDLGHEIIIVIGDFTARIGDPTGRSKTRPALTEQEIADNIVTYLDQISKILDPARLSVVYNATWFDALTSRQWIELCGKTTVAQIIEREDFSRRLEIKQPIGFHELMYPLLQGYDSVVLKAEIEFGGTDQTFNLMMGRHLQEHYGQSPQIIFTMPILEGTDGVQKMSKSYGNSIGLAESADQAYGKLMSISDDLMWRYAQLLLNIPDDVIVENKKEVACGGVHPMKLKKDVAYRIVERFWGALDAQKGQEYFESLFQKKDFSAAHYFELPHNSENPIWIVELLKILGSVTTTSEARRLIEAGAITVDEKKIVDFKAYITTCSGMKIKVGKHKFYQIK